MNNPFSVVPATGTVLEYTEAELRLIRARAVAINRAELVAWQNSVAGEAWFADHGTRRPYGVTHVGLARTHELVINEHVRRQHYA